MKERIQAIQRKVGVAADGIIGPATLAAIEKALADKPQGATEEDAGTSLASLLVSIAAGQIGTAETTKNQGPGIAKYWQATSYPEGYKNREPWCAAFMAWVVAEAGKRVSLPFKLPRSAAAFAWEAWGRENGLQVVKAPQSVKKGDVVIYSFSHIGLAESDSRDGTFTAIEGNTNGAGDREGGAVLRKTRKLSLVRFVVRLC